MLPLLLAIVCLWAPPAAGRSPAAAQALSDAFADAAARVLPATVRVEVERGRSWSPGLEALARECGFSLPREDGRGSRSTTGSGVVVRADGLVLTNHHVVAGASAIEVEMRDGKRHPAALVGADPLTDLAVLRLDGGGPYPAAPLGDSDALRVGDWVLAVGHPYELPFSLGAGVVSARGRRDLARGGVQDFVQTDMGVHPGASGGPLFDLDGEVVGIITAIWGPAGAAGESGISLAIPSDLAGRVAREIVEAGRVSRAAIGLLALEPGEDGRRGVAIAAVTSGGPADRAGLRPGDVVLAVDGEPVPEAGDLRAIVLARGTGARLRIEYGREGSAGRAVVVVPVDERALVPDLPAGAAGWGGLVLQPDLRGGLRIAGVVPGSPAAMAGLAAGDLVLEVLGEPVPDPGTFEARVAGRRAATLIFRRGEARAAAVVAGVGG